MALETIPNQVFEVVITISELGHGMNEILYLKRNKDYMNGLLCRLTYPLA